jgi:tRNA/rRNA methyltransferase
LPDNICLFIFAHFFFLKYLFSMNIYFILVRPSVPQNVGAAARAIKTMGFSHLRLVAPCDHLCDSAKWMAHGSTDILQRARVYATLEKALHDIDFAVGTSCKNRVLKKDYYPGAALADFLKRKQGSVSKTAVVFGREDTGLGNSDIALCDIISTVPMRTRYPSLNLAQAVMVYAYELSAFSLGAAKTKSSRTGKATFPTLKSRVRSVLHTIGILPNTSIHRRILERIAAAGDKDIALMLSVAQKALEKSRQQEGLPGR